MGTIRQLATTAVFVLVCLSTACTTLRPVAADPAGEQIRTEIRAGDTVRVVTTDGKTHSFQVTAVGASSLSGSAVRMSEGGTDAAGSRIDLPYRDIRQIEVQRINGLKTSAVVVAVVLAAAVGISTGWGSHTPGYHR